MTVSNHRRTNRRHVLKATGCAAVAVVVAGCSFSYSGSENRFSTERTFEFEAQQGDEIRVRISGTEFGNDDTGVSAGRETADADLFGPNGQTVVSLSFSGDGASDEETVSAPDSGTYEFNVRPSPDTVRATIEVDGESVLG